MFPDFFTLANGDCNSAISVSWEVGVFIIIHMKLFCLLHVNTYCSHLVKGKTPLFFSSLYFWHQIWDFAHTKQFFNSQRTPTRCPTNSTQFCHHLLGVSVRSWSEELSPTKLSPPSTSDPTPSTDCDHACFCPIDYELEVYDPLLRCDHLLEQHPEHR